MLYVLAGLYLFIFQERLIFRATTLPQDYQFRFDADFDEIDLEMRDGAVINCLHFNVPHSKGIILYFHGNLGDLSRWGEVVLPLTSYGYEVLVIDYRGYGKSTGKRSKASMLLDAETIYAHIATSRPQEEIIVYGRSLGGAFASHVAAEFSPKKLILEAPFYSTSDVAKTFAWMYPLKSMIRFDFTNYEKIPQVKCPITILHGTEDVVVPVSSGKKLAMTNESVDFIEIPGGGHNNLEDFKKYWDELEKLLATD